jgi:benzoate-CoA ligase family protein
MSQHPADPRPAEFEIPEQLNIVDYFVDARVREGRGDRIAIRTNTADYTYRDVQDRANRFGNLLRDAGCQPEQRVLVALPDGIDYVAALFGILKIGAVVVMVNPHLRIDQIEAMYAYTRATFVVTHADTRANFERARTESGFVRGIITTGTAEFERTFAHASSDLQTFPTHRDDPAIWLFSGGTSGRPKAVVQTHRSYMNTTERYGKRVLGYSEDDISIAVPKLFFGYATGSNLFFPFSVGASCVLFDERVTPEVLFAMIERHRPTTLINVPTMIAQMVTASASTSHDLSSLRLATSAGEALPAELYDRWMKTFGVELLDGLGTAEMWHIFLTNHPGQVRPGTLGTAVAGFDVKVCDDAGREMAPGEVGFLWVRGDSRAIAYWQLLDETKRAFRGEWVVSEDMLSRDADGYFTYRGRADDMLKVSGKWLSPQEVENCLLQHPAVRECAVVGVVEEGLTRPYAFVAAHSEAHMGQSGDDLAGVLLDFVRGRLETYKCPRRILIMTDLPRTHLGKIDRGRLRTQV